MKNYLLMCVLTMVSFNQAIGQCTLGLSANWGYAEGTNYVNCQPLSICGITDGAWVGNGSTPGRVTFLFSPPTGYVEVDFYGLSTTPTIYEYLEFWINGSFYDLNNASTTFTNSLPSCTPGTVSYVTSPGNLGNSGISGVVEVVSGQGAGLIRINFGCELNSIEIRNQNFGGANGTVVQVRRCLDDATGNGNCGCTLASSITTTNITCFGETNGVATAIASNGTPPYTYLWSNNSNTAVINGLSGGVYTVTVADAVGCVEIATATISAPSSRNDVLFKVSNVGCDSINNGSTTAVSDGGMAPFTYQWDATAGNQTTATASNLTVGTYKVTLTDNNGCESTGGVIVEQLDCAPPCSTNPCADAVYNNTDICALLTNDPGNPLAALDCDKDGVTNATECTDATDPLDPCDFVDTSITLPVTADQTGCPFPCPDLTPIMTILPGNIAGMSPVEVAVQVTELDNTDTDGSVVVVRIPSDPRLAFVWNIGLTQAALVPVQNADWNYLGNNGFVHSWTYNGSGLIIPANGVTALGFQAFYDPQGTDGQTTLTATIVPFGGGECNPLNNSDSERLVYFQ